MSGGARPPLDSGRVRSAARRTGLWVPALLSTLALTTVVGGIAVGHYYWTDLRASMGRMDATLEHARERQRQMVEHFSHAQALLLAQQRRLQEAEEALRTRASQLEVERVELEAARARLGLTAASRESLEAQTEVRDLARRLDGNLAALTDPGGLDAMAEILDAIADWAKVPTRVTESDLEPALGDARNALALLQDSGPAQLAQRLAQLGIQATGLRPGPARPKPEPPPGRHWTPIASGHLTEQLQTALFALHRGDEALFRLALDTANAWLAAFYDPARPEVQAVQLELAALHRLPISQDLKPLRTALARLRAVLGELAQGAGSAQDTGLRLESSKAAAN